MRTQAALLVVLLSLCCALQVEAQDARQVTFKMHRIGAFRGEALGVADFDNDGKLDVVAGDFLYIAPDWKSIKIRTIQGDIDEEGKGYNWDFMNAPLDVDGDGLLDVVSCSWHGKRIEWYRNPGAGRGDWAVATVFENGNYECGDMYDIDGDGLANEILPHSAHTAWYEVGQLSDGKRGLVRHLIDDKTHAWGGGVGDVNGDGRNDILRPGGWYEAPADPRSGEWKEHPWAMGSIEEGAIDHTPQMLVYDVNADGRNDIVTSSAHKHGIFWYEQQADGSWTQHVIDQSWTQAHSLTLADLDQDGDLDLSTGKRFMAHNGGDPDAYGKVGVYWYELDQKPAVKWTKHVISLDEGIGSGMSIPVVDLDGDGDLDIVVTGKWAGPVWFENQLK